MTDTETPTKACSSMVVPVAYRQRIGDSLDPATPSLATAIEHGVAYITAHALGRGHRRVGRIRVTVLRSDHPIIVLPPTVYSAVLITAQLSCTPELST